LEVSEKDENVLLEGSEDEPDPEYKHKDILQMARGKNIWMFCFLCQ
jgi:hypothetical protein